MIKVKDTTSISSNDYYAHFSPGIASTATDLSIITGTNSSNYDSNLGTITGSITGTTTSTSIHAKTTPNPIGLLESASLAMLNTEKSSSLTQRDDGTFASSDEWGTTTIYADESATELLGYETNYGWGSNHYFSEYDANWQPQKSIYTEGSRTTEYATIEGVWTLVKLTVDYSKMTASTL
jgi:hypothetical protein